MAVSSTSGVFGRAVFEHGLPQTKQKVAAAGFAQIFTTMLAKQMRQSMVGEDNGPMGISGGASGDIYGSFLDQAMGKALASSKSMKRLNEMIDRSLSGPGHSATSATASAKSGALQLAHNAILQNRSASALETTNSVSPNYTGVTMPADARRPILLPPSPPAAAPLLLRPPTEG
jgi:Rod binding domain-containing protein